ncbi:MAG: heavy metal translocating P-type ATPase [Spirochaetaceae bacterium]
MNNQKEIEVPVRGMDCAECAEHVRRAVSRVEGVDGADVLLGAEKAVIRYSVEMLDLESIRSAVADAGYEVPTSGDEQAASPEVSVSVSAQDRFSRAASLTRGALTLFGVSAGAVLFIVVVVEWLGVAEAITRRVPWPVSLAAIAAAGYPIFRNVVTAALHGRVLAHTLMSVGAVAAMLAGEWVTAAVVVFFMRLGDYAERFTTDKARGAVRNLEQLAPAEARVEHDGTEVVVPVSRVVPGDIVVVRPGERIPADGTVVSGHATIDQSTVTGEPMPVEATEGSTVFAATIPELGSLRVRAERLGSESTFGKVIRMVEYAEANRSHVQRLADRFSGYYLPVVAGVAALTFLLGGSIQATVAVLVVACSCAFALATPIAMLASVGAAARRGILIKGGKYIEALARADVLVVDKTGTLTLGKPRVRAVVPANGMEEEALLRLAASAEGYSEHPIAGCLREEALERNLELARPEDFEAMPGHGIRATLNGSTVDVVRSSADSPTVGALQREGATVVEVYRDGELCGYIAVADRLRPEVPKAVSDVRAVGIRTVELLTGDAEQSAALLAGALGVSYRARLLPEDKIRIVREYQQRGHTVVMVGDGINDAPALAQADVGIAMGAAGTDVAVEAADVALLRDDWSLVPEVFSVAARTMRVVRGNIGFTAVYNLAGLTLAALGMLPPVLAAAVQSLPDLGILGNSSRLLRRRN